MASEYVSIWRGDLQITYSFLVRKDYSHAGRELQQVEVFPVGTVGGGGIVFATPTQANSIIEYCI